MKNSIFADSYVRVSDPGHSWLEVRDVELMVLGVIDQVSSCSYQSRGRHLVYLEEDCDMPLFLNAYKARFGRFPYIETRHEEPCNVRELARFSRPKHWKAANVEEEE